MFQSTRPRGARLFGTMPNFAHVSFNPRARAGRDFAGYADTLQKEVSIHAPARGATSVIEFMGDVEFVSIHAPARGATSAVDLVRHGCHVSIHAPARGATW